MDFTFHIVSMEIFRVYKLFSMSCRNNVHYTDIKDARNYIYNFCDSLKTVYEKIYVETVDENKIILYVDEDNEEHVLHTIFTVNTCKSVSNDGYIYTYRDHVISIEDDSWLISGKEVGPIIGMETLDLCLDFIDYTMVTRDNVIRIQGNYMMRTSPFNKGNPVS